MHGKRRSCGSLRACRFDPLRGGAFGRLERGLSTFLRLPHRRLALDRVGRRLALAGAGLGEPLGVGARRGLFCGQRSRFALGSFGGCGPESECALTGQFGRGLRRLRLCIGGRSFGLLGHLALLRSLHFSDPCGGLVDRIIRGHHCSLSFGCRGRLTLRDRQMRSVVSGLEPLDLASLRPAHRGAIRVLDRFPLLRVEQRRDVIESEVRRDTCQQVIEYRIVRFAGPPCDVGCLYLAETERLVDVVVEHRRNENFPAAGPLRLLLHPFRIDRQLTPQHHHAGCVVECLGDHLAE